MTKQQIQLVKYGRAEEAFCFSNVEIQNPLADEVQIEVERFGLNYADVMARNGLYREAPPLPCVLGYEVVGKIVEVGKNIPKEMIGKRVVAFTRFGGYSQIVNANYFGVAEIGDYDGDKALCLATQYVTALYMSHVATQVLEGDNVLIHAAAGGVGTALIQLLKEKKVNIIAKIGSDDKIPYLQDLGVKNIINYNKEDYEKQVEKLLNGKKLDLSFNPAAGASFKKDWKLLGPAGRLLLFGGSERAGKKWGILSDLNFVRKMGLIIPFSLMGTSKSLIGVNMLRIADHKPKVMKDCLEQVVEKAIEGKLNPMIGKVYPAEKIAEAHAFLGSGKSTGKIVMKW